ncbi:MAG: redox-sensing transcriptional repressor Rex, partial [Candidatus Omnitrophica bacterium]|nr:redox-sensing transcriptional repressor Rex [Candidatus Omnitrophota bacterium]
MKNRFLAKKNNFSQETIKRLSIYLNGLRRIKDEGMEIVSSDKITGFLKVSPEQFRKDLSYFGGFGKPGVGYDIQRLIDEIQNILGVDKDWQIALVGVGKLGSAMLGFDGFSKFNLKITHAFD